MRFKANMFLFFAAFVLLAASAFFLSGFFKPSALQKKTVSIRERTFDVELADTALKRAQGLSGRGGLGENDGMLFLFDKPGTYGFWMKDMKFPLDIIWISGDRVVGFSENLQPEPGKNIFAISVYYPPEPADKVLEVNAGIVKKYDFAAGDEVKISIQ